MLANAQRFLKATCVDSHQAAADNATLAALQRSHTYLNLYPNWKEVDERQTFRLQWRKLLSEESGRYAHAVTDDEHCAIIQRVATRLQEKFGPLFVDERLRFGISQKALNLYLKFLWCLNRIPVPPHCPIDAGVLESVGIPDKWTQCDSESQYMGWIATLRRTKASSSSLSQWELDSWNQANVPARPQ